MKRQALQIVLALLLLTENLATIAQAPQKIGYQAVVRNELGQLISNQQISIQVKISRTQGASWLLYTEKHTTTTNAQGLASIIIGEGIKVSGSWLNLTWDNGTYYIETEIDPQGGSNYTIKSKQQIVSVPYALYAEKAGNGFSGKYSDLTGKPSLSDSIQKYLAINKYLTDDTLTNEVTVEITNITDIQANSAVIWGSEHWNKAPSLQKGFCYSENASPTYMDKRVTIDNNDQTYRCKVDGLISGTTYHLRAYAVTATDIIYGEETTFTTMLLPHLCANKYVQDAEGHLYNTVQIGTQCWMRENLRSTRFSDSTPIQTPSKKDFYYKQSENISDEDLPQYGYLYTLAAIMNEEPPSQNTPSSVQGICPTGWHLPSSGEWELLNAAITNDINSSDFSAKKGGYFSININFGQTCLYCEFGAEGFFATSHPPDGYSIADNHSKAKAILCQNNQCISVRCVQD
ncbi:MAG: hypothetical protein MJZ76_09425 [Bacteroidales bacterium]|nr:hypothetical protein [Bacteroidales bacterium]